MNGNQKNALKRYKSKIEYIYPILCCMVAGNLTNMKAASIANIPYNSFRTILKNPDNGSVETFEKVLEALESYLEESLK